MALNLGETSDPLQSHQTLLDSFLFNKMIVVPPNGISGGIIVLWDDKFLELDEIATTNQEVHTMIKVSHFDITWLFSCVYDSTHWFNRKIMWENLKQIKNNNYGIWVTGGDFYELLFNHERKGREAYRLLSYNRISRNNKLFWVYRYRL